MARRHSKEVFNLGKVDLRVGSEADWSASSAAEHAPVFLTICLFFSMELLTTNPDLNATSITTIPYRKRL